MKKHFATSKMTCLTQFNNGVLWLLPDMLLKICTLIALIYLWNAVMSSGVDVGMTVAQMLSYTYLSALLSEQLAVKSPATGWLSEGIILRLYGRPQTVLGQLIAVTAGGWIPMLLIFSLPMALLAPVFGVSLRPASWWFLPSLALCISLGFALELMFACLSIKLRNSQWLVERIREAIAAIFSGTVIPISVLPFGLSEIMKYQPFASLGGAPLCIFTGTADIAEVIALQLFWNAVFWPLALLAFSKSQEGMVSYGG